MSSNRSTKQKVIELLSQCGAIKMSQLSNRVAELSPDVAACFDAQSLELFKRNTVFVGSSRLSQKLDEIPRFFEGLLKVSVQLDPNHDVLVTSPGIACDAMVQRIGALFNIPVLSFVVAKRSTRQLEVQVVENEKALDKKVLVFDFENRGIDHVLSMIAKQMTVLSMRQNGNLHRAVTFRLQAERPVRLLIESSLVKKDLAEKLLARGAMGWYLLGADREQGKNLPKAEVISAEEVPTREFLLHWTRRRVGPWPDQNKAQFLDDLIFQTDRKDHRNVAALRRILATQRIIAGNDLTRDSRKVVCYSDCRLDELKSRRTFRSHLSRWDFEPFGIAICKRWLSANGCREVIYGDETVWKQLTDEKRPYFQLNEQSGNVDWSKENEWRTVGDLDLRKVPVDAAVVFVDKKEDAREVADVCRWPIVVLNDQADDKPAV
jgi:hypothetical protein